MNFAAVGRGLEMTPSLLAAASVADNLSTVPWLLAQVGLFTVLNRFYRVKAQSPETVEPGDEQESTRLHWTSTSVRITDLAMLAALPLAALWLSQELSQRIPDFPEVLWLTTVALIAAQTPWARKLKGAAVVSYFALHLFFVVIGATSNVREVLHVGPSIFLYMILILAIHAAILYGLGWLLGMDLPTLSVASQATVGGPGSALALSMAMKIKPTSMTETAFADLPEDKRQGYHDPEELTPAFVRLAMLRGEVSGCRFDAGRLLQAIRRESYDLTPSQILELAE